MMKVLRKLAARQTFFMVKLLLVVILTFMLVDLPTVNSWAENLLSKINPNWSWNAALQPDSIWHRRDYIAINRKFDNVTSEFSPEMLKAIAWCESEWRHFESDGEVFTGINRKKIIRPATDGSSQRLTRISYDFGIMQINNHQNCLDKMKWDAERIKNDPEYNIEAAVEVLKAKQRYVRYLKRKPNWQEIEKNYDLKNHSEAEITLKAYNGFQRSWEYLYRVKSVMRKKPWETMIVQQLDGEGKRPEMALQFVCPAVSPAITICPNDVSEDGVLARSAQSKGCLNLNFWPEHYDLPQQFRE